MGVEKVDKLFRSLPASVSDRINVLKGAFRAPNQAVVISMAMARLEDGWACPKCGVWVGQTPEIPPEVGDEKWDEIAVYHTEDCEWVSTRGFQIK